MKYTVNVSRCQNDLVGPRHLHYVRIEFDVIDDDAAAEKARDIAARFPEKEGFRCSLTRWETVGYPVTLTAFAEVYEGVDA